MANAMTHELLGPVRRGTGLSNSHRELGLFLEGGTTHHAGEPSMRLSCCRDLSVSPGASHSSV